MNSKVYRINKRKTYEGNENCVTIWKECHLRDQTTDGMHKQLMIERLDCSELIQGRVLKWLL